MSVNERRQHFRIDDQIYMDYRIIPANEEKSEASIEKELLGHSNQQYLDTTFYFEEIDRELEKGVRTLALTDPTTAHYLNLINAKVDYISRNLLKGVNLSLEKVVLGLGGIRFTCHENIAKNTLLKIVIYTKPKMIPIVLNAICIQSSHLKNELYVISCHFKNIKLEEEELLSKHIMHTQINNPPTNQQKNR